MNANGPLRFKQIKIVSTPQEAHLEVVIEGETPEYRYSGVPGTDALVTDGKIVTFTGIPKSSTFTLSVTDGYGDSITASISVLPIVPGEITYTYTHPSCKGLSDGKITLGQTTKMPVMYSVNELQTTECNNMPSCTYTELSSGSYESQVSFGSKNFNVTADLVNLNSVSLIVVPRPATCGKKDGTISIGGIGGGSGAPYTVKLKGPVSRSFEFPTDGDGFGNLPLGTYSVTATSKNGCSGTEKNVVVKERCD